jgi:hypothetical protein
MNGVLVSWAVPKGRAWIHLAGGGAVAPSQSWRDNITNRVLASRLFSFCDLGRLRDGQRLGSW